MQEIDPTLNPPEEGFLAVALSALKLCSLAVLISSPVAVFSFILVFPWSYNVSNRLRRSLLDVFPLRIFYFINLW